MGMKLKLGIHAWNISLYIVCVYFYSCRIRTLVASMATYSSNRQYNEKSWNWHFVSSHWRYLNFLSTDMFIEKFRIKPCLKIFSETIRWMKLIFFINVYGIIHLHKIITKTSPCNEDPLTPHFYIVKLGFTGVYIFFLFLLKTLIVGTR